MRATRERHTYAMVRIQSVISLTFLHIIHRPVLYLKHVLSETKFCLPIQVEPICFGSVDRPSLCFGCFAGVCREKERETGSICCAQLIEFHLKKETWSSLETLF
jgi:hypothetical protein